MADMDLDEEEVWALMGERSSGSPRGRGATLSGGNPFTSSSTQRRLSNAAASRMMMMIPRSSNMYAENGDGGGGGGGRGVRKSAPVNIPDWSKIYNSRSNCKRGGFSGCSGEWGSREEEDDEEEEEEEEERVPPHEWIARKLARSQISSFSVCEGAGRTLKGRDLRKVRNAVLTKTGFLEC